VAKFRYPLNANQYPVPPRERFEDLLDRLPWWQIDPLTSEDEQLIAAIELAFADDPPLDDGLTLFQGEEVDCSRVVFPEVRAYDYVSRWQDVRDDHLAKFGFAYSFLDDRGQRFYLPALMRWEVRYGRHWSAPAAAESAAMSVSGRSQQPPWRDLNEAQRAVVERWLNSR
jgi:hypothetical protein